MSLINGLQPLFNHSTVPFGKIFKHPAPVTLATTKGEAEKVADKAILNRYNTLARTAIPLRQPWALTNMELMVVPKVNPDQTTEVEFYAMTAPDTDTFINQLKTNLSAEDLDRDEAAHLEDSDRLLTDPTFERMEWLLHMRHWPKLLDSSNRALETTIKQSATPVQTLKVDS